jgi:hypothetical protein
VASKLNFAESWVKVVCDVVCTTVCVDVTIGLPLLAGAILGKFGKQKARVRRSFLWNRNRLENIKIE